jgi:hypothetical protein
MCASLMVYGRIQSFERLGGGMTGIFVLIFTDHFVGISSMQLNLSYFKTVKMLFGKYRNRITFGKQNSFFLYTWAVFQSP